MSHTVVS